MRRTLLLIPLLVPLLAACGSPGQEPGVATATDGAVAPAPSATAGGGFDPTKLAKCVRENGIPNFPDPEVDEGRISIRMPDGVRKEAADKAMEACKQYQPNGGQPGKVDPAITAQLRLLAKCMRENGVPDFPDPGADGGIELRHDKNGGGIDPESPSFKKAEEACKQFRPEPPAGSKDEKSSVTGKAGS
ncbi:hypothetical protein [Actinoplanes sp. NPDC049265]|uniref:hypothetical protein n=1 Tax=Actinoplanes sp. NPDC049265 TaxID=3363902 RepID=UPI003717BE12